MDDTLGLWVMGYGLLRGYWLLTQLSQVKVEVKMEVKMEVMCYAQDNSCFLN